MENKTIQWGWEKSQPSNMRSRDHQQFLIEQYNRNRPVEAYASSIKDLPGQQLDLFNDCGDANEY